MKIACVAAAREGSSRAKPPPLHSHAETEEENFGSCNFALEPAA